MSRWKGRAREGETYKRSGIHSAGKRCLNLWSCEARLVRDDIKGRTSPCHIGKYTVAVEGRRPRDALMNSAWVSYIFIKDMTPGSASGFGLGRSVRRTNAVDR